MPPATIRSIRNGVTPVIGASRDDLHSGDVVTVNSVNVHTTYPWPIAYKHPGSTATLSGGGGTTSAATGRHPFASTYIGPNQQNMPHEDDTTDLGATTDVAVSGYLVIL
ncbi:MAG: hypothetical protein EBT79_13370 [Actinobacteria bacterium]|nr:hypothetical protein [Actinomycetota bacterium]NBR68237.1 hypothetical protein [Actinomycetota bacterium]